jgi:hypothetical protein
MSTIWRHTDEVEEYFRLFLTSALDGGEWITPRPRRFTPRNELRHQLKRNCIEFRNTCKHKELTFKRNVI